MCDALSGAATSVEVRRGEVGLGSEQQRQSSLSRSTGTIDISSMAFAFSQAAVFVNCLLLAVRNALDGCPNARPDTDDSDTNTYTKPARR